MKSEIVMYLESRTDVPDSQKRFLTRAVRELDRSNITTMAALCELCDHAPESFKEVRNIGAKTVELMREICAAYANKETTGRK